MKFDSSAATSAAVASSEVQPPLVSRQKPIVLRPGVWVRTIRGEHDVDIDLEERHAIAGSWGYISGKNHDEQDGTANWDVRFKSGCAVTLTEPELRNLSEYELHEPTTTMQRLMSMAWLLGPGECTVFDEPVMSEAVVALEDAGALSEILKAAETLVSRLATMPGVHESHYRKLQGLLGNRVVLPMDEQPWEPYGSASEGDKQSSIGQGA